MKFKTAVLLVCGCMALFGQFTRGVLVGNVSDPSGSAVVGRVRDGDRSDRGIRRSRWRPGRKANTPSPTSIRGHTASP